jgi:hypothetical protein
MSFGQLVPFVGDAQMGGAVGGLSKAGDAP